MANIIKRFARHRDEPFGHGRAGKGILAAALTPFRQRFEVVTPPRAEVVPLE